jgi:chemotaxis family two-component system response regulator PixH
MVNTHRVLVIDDSVSACTFMAQALEKAGYAVMTANDGREGFIKALQERPLCVILDIIMPGVNGYEVCRQLRARDPQHSLPIIMVSTKVNQVDQTWGLRQGADRYLPKPFTEEMLVQTVTELVPERLRPFTAPKQETVKQMSPLRLYDLIPHRSENSESMRSSGSLSNNMVITDKLARRVYTAIDGRRNVDELCYITGLDLTQLSRALQLLLAQKYIRLYEPGGQVVDNLLLFDLH